MNSRRYLIISFFGFALILMSYLVFSENNSGYELFTRTVDNAYNNKEYSAIYEYSIRQDGMTNLSGIANIEFKDDDLYGTNYIKARGESTSQEFQVIGDKILLKSNGVYYEETREASNIDKLFVFNEFMAKKLTNVGMYMLFGDAKNFFIKEGNIVNLHLEKSQIPGISKFIYGVATTTSLTGHDVMPQIGSQNSLGKYYEYRNIEVNSIDAEFEINNDRFDAFNIIVSVFAEDMQGKRTTIEFECKADYNYAEVILDSMETGEDKLPLEWTDTE